MVFLTPSLTGRLHPDTRAKWKERYRFTKKYGLRVAFGAVTGTGCYTLSKEAATDGVKRHAKRYLAVILINSGLTCVSAGIPLLKNATKVVKYSKACHSVCAAVWRGAHNIAELPIIFCDYALFGEYVHSCGESDYDLFSNEATDFVSKFTNLSEE